MYSATKDHRIHERLFVSLDTVLFFVFVYSNVSQDDLVFIINSTSIEIIHMITVFWLDKEIWVQYRLWIHFFLRSYRTWLLNRSLPIWTSSEGKSIYTTIAMRSGAVSLIWHALGTKSLVRENALVQALMIFFTLYLSSRMSCCGILEIPGSFEQLDNIWKRLNLKWTENPDVPSCVDVNSCDDGSLQICIILVVFYHFHITFGVPTLIFWMLELRSRHKYVAEVNMHGRNPAIILNTYWKPNIVFHVGKFALYCLIEIRASAIGLVATLALWIVILKS